MGAKSVTEARQKRKRELVYIMGGKCVLCGYDKCIAALEFHHVDKSTKERQLSSGNCHSWEEDVEEVKKCAINRIKKICRSDNRVPRKRTARSGDL